MSGAMVRRIGNSALVLPFVIAAKANGLSPAAPDENLESAIAVLRHVDPEALSEAEQDRKSDEIDKAWDTLGRAGEQGIERLKAEIEAVRSQGPKDDFFMLNASALLWNLRGVSESETIARIWREVPQSAAYYYVFRAAFEAAELQDPQALPMLKAVLRDDEGTFDVAAHAMILHWPETLGFIWGCYGPRGLAVLTQVLATSKDENELKSAVVLVSRCQFLDALPHLRQVARQGPGEARLLAI